MMFRYNDIFNDVTFLGTNKILFERQGTIKTSMINKILM